AALGHVRPSIRCVAANLSASEGVPPSLWASGPAFSATQARARRPRQPAEAATPKNYFLCGDPGGGFAPSCLGERAMAAGHEPEDRTMWYRKNIGGWERAARLIGGGLMLICGVVALHASPLGLLLSGAGVVTLVTGVFGYCPACA